MGWTKRFITGGVAIPSLILVVTNSWVFVAFGVCAVSWALHEWTQMAHSIVDAVRRATAAKHTRNRFAVTPPPPLWHTLLRNASAIAIVALGSWNGVYATFGQSCAAALFFTVVGALVNAVVGADRDLPQLVLACDLLLRVLGFALCICAPAHGLLLYRSAGTYDRADARFTAGQGACLGAILLAFQADNGALFVGSALGATPFAPTISPRKTWEGVAGAFALAMLTVALVHGAPRSLKESAWVEPLHGDVPLATHLLLSAAIAFASVVGDLTMSLVKRASKASTRNIPTLLANSTACRARATGTALLPAALAAQWRAFSANFSALNSPSSFLQPK